MLTTPAVPFRPRVLCVDDSLAHPETAIGRAAGAIAAALEARNCDVVRALSFEDGEAIIGSDASLRALVLNWHLGAEGKDARDLAPRLLNRLRERHPDVPVFMTADRKLVQGSMTIEIAESVDEFVLLLEDTADFVAGRIMAAIERYRAQLLPPYARALAQYSTAARALLVGARPPGRHRVHQAARGTGVLRLPRRERCSASTWASSAARSGRCSTTRAPWPRARSTLRACSARTAATRAWSAPRARTAASCRPA